VVKEYLSYLVYGLGAFVAAAVALFVIVLVCAYEPLQKFLFVMFVVAVIAFFGRVIKESLR